MIDKLTNWQRVETVIKQSGLSINAFARHIGLARGENLYQIKKGNNGISRDLAQRVIRKYPQISFTWLMTGQGSMLADDNGQGGIPYYKCYAPEDVALIGIREPDDYVTMPMYEDCNAVIEHNWDSLDNIPNGAVLFLHRLDSKRIRANRYLIVSNNFTEVCTARVLTKTGKLKLTGMAIPEGTMHIDREDVRAIYLIRGQLVRTAIQER